MKQLYEKELGEKTKELEAQIQDIWNKNYDPQYQTTYKNTMGDILEKINREKWDREQELAQAEYEYNLAKENTRQNDPKYQKTYKIIFKDSKGQEKDRIEFNYTPSPWMINLTKKQYYGLTKTPTYTPGQIITPQIETIPNLKNPKQEKLELKYYTPTKYELPEQKGPG